MTISFFVSVICLLLCLLSAPEHAIALDAIINRQNVVLANMPDNATVYFGYGSNLWKDQMIKRCPTSEYLGIARLNGFRWIINDRGYANVVETMNDEKSASNVTWGLVYSLQHKDEEQLDINEGVPIAYTKENLTVDYWPTQEDGPLDLNHGSKKTEMLVYIDRNRTTSDVPKKEYIYRMNMGIKDAVKEGMPKEYVEEGLRKFIPDVTDEKVAGFAMRQAVFFEEEN